MGSTSEQNACEMLTILEPAVNLILILYLFIECCHSRHNILQKKLYLSLGTIELLSIFGFILDH